MAKTRVVLPSTVQEVLGSQWEAFECPACNGCNGEAAQIKTNPVTGEVEFTPAVRLCSLCRWDGTMSLAELIAHFATAAYVEKLFRMVRREIQEGTDESYESAMSLVMILYSAHEVAEEKDLGVKNVVMKNDFMTRLLALFSDLRGRRQKAYEAGTKAAEKKRVQQLNEHAQRTAEGCDIRRAAREAQKEVEAFFDQPY